MKRQNPTANMMVKFARRTFAFSQEYWSYIGPTLAIAGAYLIIKSTVAPFYWPNGDYLNHLQNAYMLLRSILGKMGKGYDPYIANAWWQSIGPALYLIGTGVPLLETWRIYSLMQALTAGLSMVLIYHLTRRHGKLLSLASSAALFVPFLVYMENPQHNLNIFLQVFACYLAIRLFDPDVRWTRARLFWFAVLLVALNLVRAGGFLLFVAFFAVLLFQRFRVDLPTNWKPAMVVFLATYFGLNLIAGATFAYRLNKVDSAVAGDRQCYLHYARRVVDGSYVLPAAADLVAARQKYMESVRTEFPYTAFSPGEDLRRQIEQVPSYSTFLVARNADDICRMAPRWTEILKRLPIYALLGDVPPRGGRQLLITMQSAATRSAGGSNFGLLKRVGPDIEAELKSKLATFSDTPFFRTASFVFDHFERFYRLNVQPSVDLLVAQNPGLDRAAFDRDKALSLLGLRTIWAGGADTIVEGFTYTMIGSIAGPITTDLLFRDQAIRMLENCASCRWLLVENLICETMQVFLPHPKYAICHIGTPFDWLRSSPKINVTNGLPPRLANELTDAPIPNDSTTAYLIAYLYFGSIIAAAVMAWAMAVGLAWRRTRNRLLLAGTQFLLLVAVAKLTFLAAFAGMGDMRYSDELRVLVLMLCPMLLGAHAVETRRPGAIA